MENVRYINNYCASILKYKFNLQGGDLRVTYILNMFDVSLCETPFKLKHSQIT